MVKFFNTSGPCNPADHYMIEVDERLAVHKKRIYQLIEDKHYFIFHAPRQTGKTTLMMGLAKSLTAGGKYACLYANVEAGQAYKNPRDVNELIVTELMESARTLPPSLRPSKECFNVLSWTKGLSSFLSKWCSELNRPLVLLLDEVDALLGDGLLSVLRQLRAGYQQRPAAFPQSICLIGVRDIRDYRIYSDSQKKFIVGGSAFNIKEDALKMGNFTEDQTARLFQQHTDVTGQVFEKESVQLVYQQTNGQPWLINALGRELCFRDRPIAAGAAVTPMHVEAAINQLILQNDVHIDQLSDKLTEPRVAKIIEPILTGGSLTKDITHEDHNYVIDLGLVRRGDHGLEIANPIYKRIIPRFLTEVMEEYLGQNPHDYKLPNGTLDIEKLIAGLIDFYRRHNEMITKRKTYTEAAHHLVFLAWLHRVVNSGGSIEPEYAVGLGRMDLHIRYGGQSTGMELKLAGGDALEKGLEQLNGYLAKLGLESGYLVLFQRNNVEDVSSIGRRETMEKDNRQIHVLYL